MLLNYWEGKHGHDRDCYYSSVRMEGLLALFSVHQGKGIDLLLDHMGFRVTCTLVTLELLTGINTDVQT